MRRSFSSFVRVIAKEAVSGSEVIDRQASSGLVVMGAGIWLASMTVYGVALLA